MTTRYSCESKRRSRTVAGPAFGRAIATCAMALLASPVMANQIVNGGFETGTFAGWTQGGDTFFTGVQCTGDPTIAAEGNCSAFLGTAGSNGTLTQSFATLAGRNYFLSFAVKYDGGTPADFSAAVNGRLLYAVTDPALGGLQTRTFFFTPETALSTLTFTFRDDPGFLMLDAVNAAVPEPASIALLGVGLAAIPLVRRRKSGAAA